MLRSWFPRLLRHGTALLLTAGCFTVGFGYGVAPDRQEDALHRALRAAYRHVRPGMPPAREHRRFEDVLGGTRHRQTPDHVLHRQTATPQTAAEIERLEALGYLRGSEPARPRHGVLVHDRERAYPGLNLVSDGHAPWAGLIDMEGRELHRWSFAFHEAFPESELAEGAENTRYLRRVALLPGGELLGIYEGLGLIKVSRDSRLLWAYAGKAHHDLEVQRDGTIFVLTREAELVPRINETRPLLHDFVAVLDADGNELHRVSVLRALENSPYASLIQLSGREGDLFHTNTLEVLDGRLSGRLPAFAAGNVLLSLREVNAVVVLDMRQERVVWALAGLFRAQHQPTVLESGNLLLFDNLGLGSRSRVLEVAPDTQEILWSYESDEFFSATCGSNMRLPNGNTLITETDAGRAFEVTPAGEIVWEYLTPHRFGPNQELIASLFEVVRLGPDAPLAWLGSADD